MALPAINIRVQADADDAVRGLNQVDGAMERVGAQARTTGNSAAAMSSRLRLVGDMSSATRAKIQQASFQVQDFAVQLASGTRASTALAQQLPQLASAFGAVGSLIGVAAAVGIPALSFALSSAQDDVDDLSEALKALADQTRDVDLAYKQFIMGLGSSEEVIIVERIQTLEKQIANEIERQAEATGRNAGAARQRLITLRAERDELLAQLEALNQAEDRFEAAKERSGDVARIIRDWAIAEATNETIKFTAQLDAAATKAANVASGIIRGIQAFRQLETMELAGQYAAYGAGQQAQRQQEANQRYSADGRLPGIAGPGGTIAGGGGGAGSSRVQSLVESLRTERETVENWYTESLEILQSANESELEAIGGHNEARLRLEQEYQDRLRGIRTGGASSVLTETGEFFGDMATAFKHGNDELLRVSKVFSAAQALINSYNAYTQVIADPTLPWFAKIPAAATVLGAGLGMVSAIRGVTAGGGGGAPAAAASSGGSSAPTVSRNVAIELQGDVFGRKQVLGLINSINEAVEDGAEIRLV